jgi:hypothetical protein
MPAVIDREFRNWLRHKNRVGLTLFSAAVDYALDPDDAFDPMSFDSHPAEHSQPKIKIKGGGQECPPHTGLL